MGGSGESLWPAVAERQGITEAGGEDRPNVCIQK